MVEDQAEVSYILEQKALELFKECDIEKKGYLTRRDFAHLNDELNLSDDVLNQVFESLATRGPDGQERISVDCFVQGFGVFFRCAGRRLSSMSSYIDPPLQHAKQMSASRDDLRDEVIVSPIPSRYEMSPQGVIPEDWESGVSSTGQGPPLSISSGYEIDSSEWDPAFTEMLSQLAANGIEPHEDGFSDLWRRLEREDPHMLPTFERFLRKVNSELSQTKSYCKSLAMMLRQKVAEHDETITTLQDELEDHVRQETERVVAEVRAQEAHERRMLQRELDERERHQHELRIRLAVLESRERELSRLVDISKSETQQLMNEKEMLEIALADRSAAEEDYSMMNDRMRTIQQELVVHQNKYSAEVGRLQAERDSLKNELEEVSNRNAQLRNERHMLNAPMVLGGNNEQFRRKQNASPVLMMAPHLGGGSGGGAKISRHSSFITGNHSSSLHRRHSVKHSPSGDFPTGATHPLPQRVPMPSGKSNDTVTNNSVNYNNSIASSDNNDSIVFQSHATARAQVYASNHSLDSLLLSSRNKGTSTASLNTIGSPPSYEHPAKIADSYRSVPYPVKEASSSLFKVVFLGDSGVGKTALLHRLCYDQFRPAFNATIGMDLHMYPVNVGDDTTVQLQLWDTAGQERYRSMTRQYFRNAHAFVLVYDILCESSFLSSRWWLEEIDVLSAKSGFRTVLLLGNKVDCADHRIVSLEQAKSLAMERGMMFAEVSAQSGFGVHEVLNQLAMHIARDTTTRIAVSPRRTSESSQIDLVTANTKASKKQKNSCVPGICN